MGLRADIRILAGLLIIAFLVAGAPVAARDWTLNPTDSIQANITLADPGDTLILNPGTYSENGIIVSKNIRIQANTSHNHNAADTIIDGKSSSPSIMRVNSDVTLTLDNLTLRNGIGGTDTGYSTWAGGAVLNYGTLFISSSVFELCSVQDFGGAIANYGTTTIDASAFTDCSATRNYGGAIDNKMSSTLTVSNSTFTRCYAYAGGGAIFANSATVKVTGSAFTRCTANPMYNQGAAMSAQGSTITIDSTSFTECTAGSLGIIHFFQCASTIRFCRFYQNSDPIVYGETTAIDARYNWWGSNDNPGSHARQSTISPWLMLGVAADPDMISSAGTSSVRANLTYDSDGGFHAPAGGHVPDGISGTWAAAAGDGSVFPSGVTTRDGVNTTVFSPSGTGIRTVSVTVDDATVSVPVIVYGMPAVDNVDPAGGRVTGGEMVTITGNGFTAATSVMFGANASPSFSVDTDTQIRAVAPANPVGTDHVTVTTPGGTSAETAADQYTYTNIPVVTGVTPSSGPTGGTLVTIAGMGFLGATDVMFGPNPPAGYIVDNDMQITAIYLTGTAGTTVDITVTSPEGTSAITPADRFTYYAQVPAILQVYPPMGPIAGGTVVEIVSATNDGFGDASSVSFDTVPATITGREPGVLTVVSPPHAAGIVHVRVTTPGGTSATSSRDQFTYYPPSGAIPADSGETLSDFPSSPANPPMTVTVNIGGDSKAWQAVVTGTKLSDLIVTGAVQPGSGSNVTAPPGTVYQYFSLVPARFTSISKAAIHFTVPQGWLDENHIDAKSIVLYHQTANGWEALPTSVVSVKDGTMYFSAESNDFSLFAIAGTPGSAASPSVSVPVVTFGSPAEPAPARTAAVTKAPVTTQTTVPLAPATADPGRPFLFVAQIGAGCIALITGGWFIHRWWIHRQNPALFEDF